MTQFKLKNARNTYNEPLAKEALDGQDVMLAGPLAVKQYKYVDNVRTDEVAGFQIWVATPENNPFKIKFLEEPDLSDFAIGDLIDFDKIEACNINGNIYFRAEGLKHAD